ncbi:MAG: RimJ/RimL family protein N-acetyltransferase [Sphingobacteriales bacterium]
MEYFSWSEADLNILTKLNLDEDVMRFFESTLDRVASKAWLDRQMKMFDVHGFCYFKTLEKGTGEFVGIIGISLQDYPSDFNPSVDIGYRLNKKFWNMGLATEGALAMLDFSKNKCKINMISCVASKPNKGSIHIMEKVGFTFQYDFVHPNLARDSWLQPCVYYSKNL